MSYKLMIYTLRPQGHCKELHTCYSKKKMSSLEKQIELGNNMQGHIVYSLGSSGKANILEKYSEGHYH